MNMTVSSEGFGGDSVNLNAQKKSQKIEEKVTACNYIYIQSKEIDMGTYNVHCTAFDRILTLFCLTFPVWQLFSITEFALIGETGGGGACNGAAGCWAIIVAGFLTSLSFSVSLKYIKQHKSMNGDMLKFYHRNCCFLTFFQIVLLA